MRPHCEIVVRSFLPAFRSMLAKSLIEDFNFSQTTVAKKLGISQAAISYYKYSKRGKKFYNQLQSSKIFHTEVKKIAERIAHNDNSDINLIPRMCALCKILRSEKIF